MHANGSCNNGDGSRTRYMKCDTCRAPFVLVIEEMCEEIRIDSRIWSEAKNECDHPAVQLDLISIGRAAVAAQINPAKLERIAQRAGVKVAARLNGVAYFHRRDVERFLQAAAQPTPNLPAERRPDNVTQRNS